MFREASDREDAEKEDSTFDFDEQLSRSGFSDLMNRVEIKSLRASSACQFQITRFHDSLSLGHQNAGLTSMRDRFLWISSLLHAIAD